ncbi:MAG: hypothetical protein FJX76_05845 [Armatimonadetes bacterium]|nr:hypothetical protein [Armatimonadota bacterium]
MRVISRVAIWSEVPCRLLGYIESPGDRPSRAEEQVLFPYVTGLEADRTAVACFATVFQPISVMMMEHEAAGDLLARMRVATHGYTLPEGACASYSALFLEDLVVCSPLQEGIAAVRRGRRGFPPRVEGRLRRTGAPAQGHHQASLAAPRPPPDRGLPGADRARRALRDIWLALVQPRGLADS